MYHSKKRIPPRTGNQYWYLQRSRRIPGRKNPKTESWYVGPVGAAFSVIRVGVALATKQAARDKVFREVEFKDIPAATPVAIAGLGMSRQWSATELFEHESGIKSGAAIAAPSSGGGEQPSGLGDATSGGSGTR